MISTTGMEIKNLNVRFFNRRTGQEHEVIRNLHLHLAPGDFVCVLGPSGCGKTTLLNCIAGFINPAKGNIRVGDQLVSGPSSSRGVVFQEYGLFPWFTVEQNVQYGLKLKKLPRAEMQEISRHYLRMVGLSGFERHYPHELSGGMKQRVSLARALANQPQILLLDELFAALDAQTREQLQVELLQIWENEKITCLFITHSVSEAVFLADRAVIMLPNPGRIAEDVRIDIPRIRDRTTSEFVKFVKEINELIYSQSGRLT